MTKSFLSISFDAGRRSRPTISVESLPESKNSRGRSASFTALATSRSLAIPTAILRKLDFGNDTPPQKPPILTLQLSSNSYLNADICDEQSNPVYTARTEDSQTVVSRQHPTDGDTKVVEIKWPKDAQIKGKSGEGDSVLIRIREGRWKFADAILHQGSILSHPRKFQIPGYPRPLRWKEYGNAYWCFAHSVKTPIAIFEPGNPVGTMRLKVFETLHDKYDSRSMRVYNGVSLLLLDYLITTTLLLVTGPKEWQSTEPTEPPNPNLSDSFTTLNTAPSALSLITPQSATGSSTSSHWQQNATGDLTSYKQKSKSTDDLRARPKSKILPALPRDFEYLEAEYHSEDEDESVGVAHQHPTRAISPSTESVYYPQNDEGAPSHTYLDPEFYVPPVPPLPPQFANQSNLPSPLSPISPTSPRRRRQLPIPPRIDSSLSVDSAFQSQSVPLSAPIGQRLSRTHSFGSRRLPVPPVQTGNDSSNTLLKHSFSVHRAQLATSRNRSSSVRSLPPTPTSAPPRISLPPTHHEAAEEQYRVFTRKDSQGDLLTWASSIEEHVSIVENPPPAYNCHTFNNANNQASSFLLDTGIKSA